MPAAPGAEAEVRIESPIRGKRETATPASGAIPRRQALLAFPADAEAAGSDQFQPAQGAPAGKDNRYETVDEVSKERWRMGLTFSGKGEGNPRFPLAETGSEKALVLLSLTFDTVAGPRHGLHAFLFNLFVAGHAQAESAVFQPFQRLVD